MSLPRNRRDHVATMRRLLDGFEHHHLTIDRDALAILAAITVEWPATSMAEREMAARRLYASGRSMREVGQHVGGTYESVSKLLDGLPRRVGRGHRLPDETRRRVLELVDSGLSQREAARIAGTDQAVVSRLLSAA